MRRWNILHSVVTRLVLSLVLGGLLLSVGQTWLATARAERQLRLEMSQQVGLTVHNAQAVLRESLMHGQDQQARTALAALLTDPNIRAARVLVAGKTRVELGDWSPALELAPSVWNLAEHGVSAGTEIDLRQPT